MVAPTVSWKDDFQEACFVKRSNQRSRNQQVSKHILVKDIKHFFYIPNDSLACMSTQAELQVNHNSSPQA
jgi:hypothetical protein